MPKRIIFWGATGQAKVLREFMAPLGYELVAVFDNDPSVAAPFPGVPLFYGRDGFQAWSQEEGGDGAACLVAIGGSAGRDRLRIQRYLEANRMRPVNAVHPTAYVAGGATLGRGSQVLASATVCAEVTMGEACIINTAASVDHESTLGDGVHISVGARLAGCVSVGDCSLIGVGAVVLPRVRIGSDVIVGAGSVVTRDIADGKVAYGNPARVRRDNIREDG